MEYCRFVPGPAVEVTHNFRLHATFTTQFKVLVCSSGFRGGQTLRLTPNLSDFEPAPNSLPGVKGVAVSVVCACID